MDSEDRCFFVMPFREELHFVYLYLQDHLKKHWGISAERGDDEVLSREVLGKIQWQITRADFVVADITGGNPNVFYEIGYAQALKKPLIFLSRDAPEKSPFDVRGFDIISYRLSDDEGLRSRLDNAVYNVFRSVARYESLYRDALQLLDSFQLHTRSRYPKARPENFLAKVMRERERLPPSTEIVKYAEFLVPRALDDPSDIEIARAIDLWAMTLENEVREGAANPAPPPDGWRRR